MNAKIVILLGLAALAAAKPGSFEYGSYGSGSSESYESGSAEYNFQYAVRDDSSGNDFGHQETRDDDNTQGSYYVYLPDGRRQTVTYFVDGDSGYIADVKYSGEARYPDSYESSSFESFESFESYEAPRRYYYGSNESK